MKSVRVNKVAFQNACLLGKDVAWETTVLTVELHFRGSSNTVAN